MMQLLFAVFLTAFSVIHHGGNKNTTDNGMAGTNNAISEHSITFWSLFGITAVILGILLFLFYEES